MVPSHVAVVSARPQLVTEISRLCAMAGQPVQVASSATDVTRVCRSASLTVVDDVSSAVVSEVAAAALGDVVVVTDDAARVTAWQVAVQLGAKQVVTLPDGAADLLDLLAIAGERPGPSGPLVGVIGGRGGAGTSTLAVALAWVLAQRGTPVTLVDLDAAGGGLDLALGLENAAGLRWTDLREARGVVASAALREQLPSVGALCVVSAASRHPEDEGAPNPMPDRCAVGAVIDAGRRGGGIAVVDLPRTPSDVTDAVIASCAAVLLVVPADVRSVAAATAVVRRVQPLCDDVRAVVRVDPRSRLRDRDVAAALGIAVAATVRTEAGLTAATDRAQLLTWLRRSRLARTAGTIAADLVPRTVEKTL